jgi:hypothetical protein
MQENSLSPQFPHKARNFANSIRPDNNDNRELGAQTQCYGWFFQGEPMRGKGRLEVRRRVGPVLLKWAQSANVTLDPELRCTIDDGFPNDDAFDATVGLFGMLEVLMNRRKSGEPDEDCVRKLASIRSLRVDGAPPSS